MNQSGQMKKTLEIVTLAVGLVVAGSATSAACFADYKAKKENPLRLHYGVIELDGGACSGGAAARTAIQERISAGGWTLLNILGVFDEGGLEERKASAGKFYLRF